MSLSILYSLTVRRPAPACFWTYAWRALVVAGRVADVYLCGVADVPHRDSASGVFERGSATAAHTALGLREGRGVRRRVRSVSLRWVQTPGGYKKSVTLSGGGTAWKRAPGDHARALWLRPSPGG